MVVGCGRGVQVFTSKIYERREHRERLNTLNGLNALNELNGVNTLSNPCPNLVATHDRRRKIAGDASRTTCDQPK